MVCLAMGTAPSTRYGPFLVTVIFIPSAAFIAALPAVAPLVVGI
jgi:hypothetical protein